MRAFDRFQLAAALFMFAFASVCGAATTPDDAEYRIKAAFLYHFCNYVKWPAEAFETEDDPLVVGVAAPTSVVDRLQETVNGRLAQGRPVSIRRIQSGDSLDGLHVLYIANRANANVVNLRAANTRALLTITESADGLESGGVINFIIEDDRVRFDVAPGIARERDLDISAQLLTVARNIKGNAG